MRYPKLREASKLFEVSFATHIFDKSIETDVLLDLSQCRVTAIAQQSPNYSGLVVRVVNL